MEQAKQKEPKFSQCFRDLAYHLHRNSNGDYRSNSLSRLSRGDFDSSDHFAGFGNLKRDSSSLLSDGHDNTLVNKTFTNMNKLADSSSIQERVQRSQKSVRTYKTNQPQSNKQDLEFYT